MPSRKSNQFNSLVSGRNLASVPKSMRERYKYLIPQNKDSKNARDVLTNLNNLEYFLPGEEQIVYDFCNFLKGYLHEWLVPEGFLLSCMLALNDIQNGSNGFTGEKIDGLSFTDEERLNLQGKIPHIAKSLYGKDFGNKVQSFYDETIVRVTEIQKSKKQLVSALGEFNKTNTGEGFEYKELTEQDNQMEQMSNQEIGDTIYKIRDVIFEFMNNIPRDSGGIDDKFNQGVNPFYNQTEQGFFLEYYYGTPNSLRTPRGEIAIPHLGGGRSNDITPELEKKFLEMFDAEIFMEETYTEGPFGGVVGPVYALKKVGDRRLPIPKKRNHKEFLGYDECKENWEKVVSDHEKV